MNEIKDIANREGDVNAQAFVYPPDLFAETNPPAVWSCVRTRPRWEKRFAKWLHGNNMAFFLPVVPKRTRSHRKSRKSDLPLFTGYVFVAGLHTKADFTRSASVAYVLVPRSEEEHANLNGRLTDVWRLVGSGQDIEASHELQPGVNVRIVAGALMGLRGRFLREGAGGKLLVWLDLLGAGVATEIADATLVEQVD